VDMVSEMLPFSVLQPDSLRKLVGQKLSGYGNIEETFWKTSSLYSSSFGCFFLFHPFFLHLFFFPPSVSVNFPI